MNREEIRNCEFAVYRKTGEAVSINYVDGRDNVYFFEIHRDRWPVIAYDDENIGRPEDFDECPYETISPDDFGRLVRAEIRCEELLKSHSFLPLFTVEGEYKTAAEDLFEGLNKLFEEQWTAEEFMKWFNVIASNFNVIGYDEEYEFRRIRTLNENELLCYATLDLKFEYDCFEDFDDSLDLVFFEKPLYTLKMLLSNRGKDVKDWQIPEELLKQYVLDQDNDELRNWSPEDKETYRFFLEKLAETEPKVLQKMGYLIYTGDSIYKQDWPRCRDIFEKYYALTGDASAMNTLGYIYYYGRCNNGEGEYEKAFRCFSVGHAFGYYESTYKLGDMFAHSYGVVKSEKTAKHLYWMVYNDSIKEFLNGEYRGQFADAALRIANVYKNGIDEEQDDEKAFRYYLQADYAIRKRMETGDYYGDTGVFAGIHKALNELLDGRKLPRKVTREWPFAFYDITGAPKGRRIKTTLRNYSNGSLGLTAEYLPFPEETKWDIPMMFLTYEKEGYCGLLKKVKLKTDPAASIEIKEGNGFFIFNKVEKHDKGVWHFYHDEKLTAVLHAESFFMDIPSRKKKKDQQTYMMVSVRFSPNGRTYDYICEDETVEQGDRVIVNGYEGETEVEVISVIRKTEEELFVPVDRYKKIVRKA